jgi:hypothetical protein
MSSVSRLGRQLEEIAATLAAAGAPFALIGGLALAPYKVIRATQDIDLLIDAAMADAIHQALSGLGYLCLHRSADAGNYLRGDERIDFIYAHRPAALGLLRNARPLQTEFGMLQVVSPEGLIGLKLQAISNNPRRTQDLADIRSLIAANREILDMDEIRGYFRLFGKEPLLEELLG